jgi:hypothetical protein
MAQHPGSIAEIDSTIEFYIEVVPLIDESKKLTPVLNFRF